MVKKHWLKLGAVAVALLLIPRRSSMQAQDTPQSGVTGDQDSEDGIANQKDSDSKPLDKSLNTDQQNI